METTPAPWVANPKEQYHNGSKNTFEINHGNDGECVAEVVHGFDNARLMAAAPELFAAALDFVTKVESGRAKSTDSYSKFKSAINKALGES